MLWIFTTFSTRLMLLRIAPSIGHTFNAVESAVMINKSKSRSIAEKHAAYREIIANYPDMEIPDRIGVRISRSGVFISIEHAFVKSNGWTPKCTLLDTFFIEVPVPFYPATWLKTLPVVVAIQEVFTSYEIK